MALIDDILALPGGYANAETVAVTLSAGRTRIAPTPIGYGHILSNLGDTAGGVFLQTLEALVSTQPHIKYVLAMLGTGTLDIGDTSTQAGIDKLATAGVLTADQATTLKALAIVPDPVTAADVLHALEGH